MSIDSPQNLKRPLVVLIKMGYHEITSFIAISGVFCLLTLPLITIGATLLALLDVGEAIYCGVAPSSEWERIKYFSRSVRENIIRGIPLSALILFIFINTAWYFAIVLSGQARNYIIGGLAGLYACLLVISFAVRIANIMTQETTSWQAAVRSAGATWTDHPHFTVLQISIAALALLVSLAVPVALPLLFPSCLVLFEILCYNELTGTNTQTVLARYEGAT